MQPDGIRSFNALFDHNMKPAKAHSNDDHPRDASLTGMTSQIDPKFRQNFLNTRRLSSQGNGLDADCLDDELDHGAKAEKDASLTLSSHMHSPPAKAIGNLQRTLTRLTISKTRDEENSTKQQIGLRTVLEKAPKEDEDLEDDDDDDIIFNKDVKLKYRGKVVDFSTIAYPKKKQILDESYNSFSKAISRMQITSLWNDDECIDQSPLNYAKCAKKPLYRSFASSPSDKPQLTKTSKAKLKQNSKQMQI